MKARLSAYLRKVRAGQTILILDRDEPVARLERAGLLRRATRRLSLERLRAAAPKARASVVEALLEERRRGR